MSRAEELAIVVHVAVVLCAVVPPVAGALVPVEAELPLGFSAMQPVEVHDHCTQRLCAVIG